MAGVIDDWSELRRPVSISRSDSAMMTPMITGFSWLIRPRSAFLISDASDDMSEESVSRRLDCPVIFEKLAYSSELTGFPPGFFCIFA